MIKSVYTPLLLIFLVTAGSAFGQTDKQRTKNNPYSPSPAPRERSTDPPDDPRPENRSGEIAFVMLNNTAPPKDDGPIVVKQPAKVAKSTDTRPPAPTDIYRVSAGDVLFVDIKNVPHGSGYYTVRPDGTIDYPLAGEKVLVADRTAIEIERSIAAGITLFKDPRVEVKVREFASHKIKVTGMADNPGDKSLQREAMPLFAIRAEAGVDAKATKAIITRRSGQSPETYRLNDASTDRVLIYPGDAVEFTLDTAVRVGGSSFYFIAGEVLSAGQKPYTPGLTLFQAILASGGQKGDPKKAIIRRKSEKGTLSAAEHNLRAIRRGKALDPTLSPGDMIEISN